MEPNPNSLKSNADLPRIIDNFSMNSSDSTFGTANPREIQLPKSQSSTQADKITQSRVTDATAPVLASTNRKESSIELRPLKKVISIEDIAKRYAKQWNSLPINIRKIIEKGIDCLNQQKVDDGLIMFIDALGLHPESLQILLAICESEGLVEFKAYVLNEEKPMEARLILENSQNKKGVVYYYVLVLTYAKLRDYQKALMAIDRYFQLTGRYVESDFNIWHLRSQCQLALGQYDAGLISGQVMLRMSPHSSNSLLCVIRAHLKLKSWDQAIKLLERLISLRFSEGKITSVGDESTLQEDIYPYLGLAHSQLGRHKLALQYFKQSKFVESNNELDKELALAYLTSFNSLEKNNKLDERYLCKIHFVAETMYDLGDYETTRKILELIPKKNTHRSDERAILLAKAQNNLGNSNKALLICDE